MLSAAPDLFFFSGKELGELGERLHREYAGAQPFPHIVIDDFLPVKTADEVLAEFPSPDEIEWQRFKSGTERKLATSLDEQMRPATRHLLAQFNSSALCGFLEKLTGIEGVIPDPHFVGGGLHQIQRGGFLKMHADFNWHARLRLDRRINLLLYFNKNWREEYGGELELWDERGGQMHQCVQRILPVFNRCVVFSTTSTSFHGHPNPLACPEGWTRKSMALYYYTQGRPEAEKHESHSTLFRERPGTGEALPRLGAFARTALKKTVPPLFFDLARWVRSRRG
jgi:Rps23 Pro-64 3,4-dihydroxylase Tpa1-like proline 4-hydroxylase